MKRTTWPRPRKCRAIGRTLASFTPRLTTTLTFTGKRRRGGGLDPVEHELHREVDIVHGAEYGVVERVEADRDAPQSCIA